MARRSLTHWLEAVSPTQFRVCFRETWHADDGFTDGFHFNWLAVENRNVEACAVEILNVEGCEVERLKVEVLDVERGTMEISDAP